jgi:hypothetical protein
MFETFAEVDVNVDMVMRGGRCASGTGEDPHTDEGSERRVEGLTPRIIGEGLGSTMSQLPLANRSGNPSEMQADDGGEKDDGAEGLILFGDQLNGELLNEGRISAEGLREPEQARHGVKKGRREEADMSAQKPIQSTGADGESASNIEQLGSRGPGANRNGTKFDVRKGFVCTPQRMPSSLLLLEVCQNVNMGNPTYRNGGVI